jgi:hypothetical protein
MDASSQLTANLPRIRTARKCTSRGERQNPLATANGSVASGAWCVVALRLSTGIHWLPQMVLW